MQDNTETKEKQQSFKNETFYIQSIIPIKLLEFSNGTQEVFKAGLALWKYYHSQEFRDSKNPYNPNASLYDIKAYFQGFNMNHPQKSQDLYLKIALETSIMR